MKINQLLFLILFSFLIFGNFSNCVQNIALFFLRCQEYLNKKKFNL